MSTEFNVTGMSAAEMTCFRTRSLGFLASWPAGNSSFIATKRGEGLELPASKDTMMEILKSRIEEKSAAPVDQPPPVDEDSSSRPMM